MTPPRTYGDWLKALDAFAASPGDERIISAMQKGTFEAGNDYLPLLQDRITKAVNTALNDAASRFASNINRALSEGEPDTLRFVFAALKKRIDQACFFVSLSFLPRAFRDELLTSVKTEMTSLRTKALRSLGALCEEDPSHALEDALLFARRVKFFNESP